ncbi:MAG: hypothetical protein AAF637_12030 [Pseudomonadota bacterium]
MPGRVSTLSAVAGALMGLFTLTSGPSKGADTDMCRELAAADIEQLKGRQAVVIDIDGVLTKYFLLDYGRTNGAFLDQGVAYARADAALMLNIYHRRGYAIVYMAGRPRQLEVLGKSMCQATLDWLESNGFPIERGDTLLLLRDGASSVMDAQDRGTAMAEWMGGHGTKLFASMVNGVKQELGLVPVYGYVDSDVVTDAFLEVGVPARHIFTIGNKGITRLGYRGSHAIVGPGANPGFTEHVRQFVVPDVRAAAQ